MRHSSDLAAGCIPLNTSFDLLVQALQKTLIVNILTAFLKGTKIGQ